MYLKKHAKWVSIILLFVLLALYSSGFLPDAKSDILVATWTQTFHRVDGNCVYWIVLRLCAWILVYLRLLRLDCEFSIYLYLRQRSYLKIYARTCLESLAIIVSYYTVCTLVMAFCHSMFIKISIGTLLVQEHLPTVLAEECLECLSFCLAAYLLNCVLSKPEASFAVALVLRVILNFITNGMRPKISIQVVTCVVVLSASYWISYRGFERKITEI